MGLELKHKYPHIRNKMWGFGVLCLTILVSSSDAFTGVSCSCSVRRKTLVQSAKRSNIGQTDNNSVEDLPTRGLHRRRLLGCVPFVIGVTSSVRNADAYNPKSRTEGYAIQKTEEEWEKQLSPMQSFILRTGGTEKPFSSVLEGEERKGTYSCAGCGTDLFESSQKFHSGTGWPSFARSLPGVEIQEVGKVQQTLLGAELRCKTCGGHLGDVFGDGYLFVGTPAFTSGKRFCIDGGALVFHPSNGDPDVRGDLPPKDAGMPG